MIALLAILVASIAAGFTGFGFNLVAVPLLALVLSPEDAVIVALVLGAIVSLVLATVAMRHREVDYQCLTLLAIGSLPGSVIGTSLFRYLEGGGLRIGIGLITAASAILLFVRPAPTHHPRIRYGSLGVGLVGGVLAATTGTGGPPVVIYLMAHEPEGQRVRGTVLAYGAIVSLIALLAHAVRGQLESSQMRTSLDLVPALAIGLPLGFHLFRRASGHTYRRIATSTLLIVGIVGIVVAARA
jgi:uncharacterized membrane protein YfcA